jgi:teichuronic acid biosynthesis glycosyltransferase TuaC
MKILVLSHMYPSTANEVGGIFVHYQIKALLAQGCEIRVISPVPWVPPLLCCVSSKWRAYASLPHKALWEGVEVRYPRYLAFPRAGFFCSSGKRMYRGVRELIERIHRDFPFQVIHAHVALPDGDAASRLTRRLEKPLVITIHGQDLQRTIHRNSRCFRRVFQTLNAASRVIVVSRKLKRIAVEQFGMEDKYVIVPNGVDPERILDSGTAVREQGGEFPILLSVSSLIKIKGIDLNLRAVARLRDKYPTIRYVVIGDGSEKSKLKALTRKLGIEDRVTFLGRLPHQEAMQHMAACDIFSLPSWEEGFGVVYLEAVAHGKPVIACRGEGIEDVVTHGETGLLVKPKAVDSLVEAIRFLLDHSDKAKAIGERARELILTNYTWEKNAERTLRVYKEVLREKQGVHSNDGPPTV